nr:FHA domain-containing protein [Neobacillus sp. Marseille-Q6967]
MGKTTVEHSKNQYFIENKLTYPEAINQRELQGIARGLVDCLIPVATEKTKKGVVLKSSIEGMISLKTYFSSVVSKKMFLDVIVQLVAVVKECEKNLMNVNNLMLESDYIFLDPRTKKIKCIFWPIVNNANPSSLSEFFHELPFGVVFTKHENHDYVRNYLRYFKEHTPFSINSFEKLIFELTGKIIEKEFHIPAGATGDSSGLTNKAAEAKIRADQIAYNPFSSKASERKQGAAKVCTTCAKVSEESARFCSSCGTPLHHDQGSPGSLEDLGKTDTQSFSETTVLGAENYGGTTVLGADVNEEPDYPYLIREKTQEKIVVNKPVFRIGKESRYCDYFVKDNNAISRSHADIITRDRCFYLIDHNSTNKTYVDGRVIPVEKEVEIFSGTKVKLANEDFVFYI